jgi:MFS family permease
LAGSDGSAAGGGAAPRPGALSPGSAPARPDPPPATGAAQRPGTATPPGAAPLAAEGGFQALAQGLGEAYLGAFALFLGAGGLTLGLIGTLPTAATAAAQILAQRLLRRIAGTRALLTRAWIVQAAGYAALGVVLLLPYPSSVVALIAVAGAAWGFGGLAIPAWTALVSAIVPRARTGWFFGLRGSMQQAGTLLAILAGGAFLSWMTRRGREGLGFALLFLGAALARLLGATLLARVPERARPPADRRRPAHLKTLLESAKARRLAVYLWTLHLATHTSSPFFVPYMIRELRYPYVLIGALVAVPAIVKVLTVRFWGRLADRVGPGPLLRSSGWFVGIVPLPWIFFDSPWVILLAQIYSGLCWGAFELAQASSLLQATRGRERTVGLFNAVDGAMLIAGSLLGGVVVELFDARGGRGYHAAFAVSILGRYVPAVLLLWRVRGLGRPTWSHLKIPMRLWAVRPTRGFSLRPWGQPPPEEPGADAKAVAAGGAAARSAPGRTQGRAAPGGTP